MYYAFLPIPDLILIDCLEIIHAVMKLLLRMRFKPKYLKINKFYPFHQLVKRRICLVSYQRTNWKLAITHEAAWSALNMTKPHCAHSSSFVDFIALKYALFTLQIHYCISENSKVYFEKPSKLMKTPLKNVYVISESVFLLNTRKTD